MIDQGEDSSLNKKLAAVPVATGRQHAHDEAGGESAPAAPAGQVWLVDDSVGVRESTTFLLKTVGLATIAFSSPAEFLRAFNGEAGCVILDIRMPEVSGLEVFRRMQVRNLANPVIFLTGHGDVSIAVRAMRAGAFDFLEKPIDDQVLIDTVLEALRVDAEQRRKNAVRSDVQNRLARLTERESSIAHMLVTGKSSKEIAAEMSLSVRTIEGYRGRIMSKLEADSFAQMIKLLGS
jgi:FixJ family two-component response regulator